MNTRSGNSFCNSPASGIEDPLLSQPGAPWRAPEGELFCRLAVRKVFNGKTVTSRGERHMDAFVNDIKKIRDRARRHIDDGAVTESYAADREQVIKVLNEVLATELVCTLRYRRHYYTASGINSDSVKAEFLQHANEEQQHADLVAERIVQLNGEPNFNPEGLATRSHAEYVEGNDLVAMIKEDLVAERIAIETYSEIARWIADGDPTTRRMIEQILEKEEEHAEDMASLLANMPGASQH
ncbi:MAG TPA: ferritin-like domain-containing protein [Magnetospirillaceae bacterium]|jgi:bacterioferritin